MKRSSHPRVRVVAAATALLAGMLTLAPGAEGSTPAVEQAKLAAADAGADDQFGNASAVDGDTVVVGASHEGEGGADAGAAYVFVRSGSSWSQQAKLTASDAAAGDSFGSSVAISGDTVVVGAPYEGDGGADAGAAYVFVRSGTSWSQQAKLTASDATGFELFGWSVAVQADTAVVGAIHDYDAGSSSGAAYVFVRSGSSWTEQAKLMSSDAADTDNVGWSIGLDGDTAVIGAIGDESFTGAAYVFVRSGSSWSQQAKLTAADAASQDRFGHAVGFDGGTVVIASVRDDDDGDRSGSAYAFVGSGSSWSEQAKLTASDAAANGNFGVSLGVDGDIAVIGAHGDDSYTGAAYVFVRSGSSWAEEEKLTASDAAASDRFGISVGFDGQSAVMGATGDDDDGNESGSAYVFVPVAVPGSPTGVAATSSYGGASVSWTAPASDGGSPITGYQVTPYIGGSPETPVLFESTDTTQLIGGLAVGTEYTFTVAAVNDIGTGPESAASNAVTPHEASFTVEQAVEGPLASDRGWSMFGGGFGAVAGLTITVDDPGTPESPDVTDTSHTTDIDGSFFLSDEDLSSFGLAAGVTVTVSDGTITKDHVVTDVAVTSIDRDADTIEGTAAPGSTVDVTAGEGWPNDPGPDARRLVTADGSGDWIADFSTPGPDPEEDYGTHDLDTTSAGTAEQRESEADGFDATWVRWSMGFPPSFQVFPETDGMFGDNWPDGETVYVEIDDPATGTSPDWSGTSTTVGDPCPPGPCGPGNFGFDLAGVYDIEAGDVVTAEVTGHPSIAASHVVQVLSVTDVDYGADTVTGTTVADADNLRVFVLPSFNSRYPVADGAGDWTADFSVAEGGQPAYDLILSESIFAQAAEGDGQTTVIVGGTTVPRSVAVDPQIWIWDGDTVTVSGEGWDPGESVSFAQCTRDIWSPDDCLVLPEGPVTVAGDGTFSQDVVVSATLELPGGDHECTGLYTDQYGSSWGYDCQMIAVYTGTYEYTGTQMGFLAFDPNVDFDWDASTDRSVFRPDSGAWYVDGQDTTYLGVATDIPVPADYFKPDGGWESAVFRPSTGAWYIDGDPTPVYLGLSTDIPVPGDYNGDTGAEPAVFRPDIGAWFAWYPEGISDPVYFGLPGDIPVPGDYDGDGATERAVWRPSTGAWYIEGEAGPTYYGLPGDVPVPGDYDGDGITDIAVWRQSVGAWYVLGEPSPTYLGLDGDIPVPGDYVVGGVTQRAVFRPSVGAWYTEGDPSPTYFGLPTDTQLVLPYAIAQAM